MDNPLPLTPPLIYMVAEEYVLLLFMDYSGPNLICLPMEQSHDSSSDASEGRRSFKSYGVDQASDPLKCSPRSIVVINYT